ncbi:MAG TPA: TIGR02206 family membrane protein [Anaerolineales bacterium]|nr:TIGR02206 family membrane protein [Anaerolineales bacterium]
MNNFFASDFPGPAFELFSQSHLFALGVLFALNIFLTRSKYTNDKAKNLIRWTLALILLGNEIAWHIWNATVGRWTIQTMLPLHLCSVLVWLGAIMLITKNYRIYEFMYLMGIGGAMQALATPDLGIYGFPHFRFFQTFTSHGLIVTAAVYMTVVEGFRPTWKSLLRVAIWMNVYMVIIYFLNDAIGSNYLMVNGKPDTPSLLDVLPPWPLYILYMEAIGVISVLALYLPFAIHDWRNPTHKIAVDS